MQDLIDLYCKYALSNALIGKSFIVGGTVRDIVMNKPVRDIDIAVYGDSLAIGQAFADEVKATFVLLDEAFNSARIVLGNEHMDICSVRKGSITDDLGERDITINAMAIPLFKYCEETPGENISGLKAAILDPFNGLTDIRDGVIRMISSGNLVSDPLRLLRIYRFAVTLGFSIDTATSEAVNKLCRLIGSSAAERVSEELRYILQCNNSAPIIKAMYDSGLLTELFPNLEPLTGNAWPDLWSSYNCAEEILSKPELYFGDRSGPVEEFFRIEYRRECLKLAILLIDAMSAEDSFKKLRLSRKEMEYIRLILARKTEILRLNSSDKSGVMAFLRKLDNILYALLVYIFAVDSVSPSLGSPLSSLANDLIHTYQDEYFPRMKILPLINGYDLMEQFGLSPSVFFREILSSIELLVLEGKITTREEALSAAGKMIKGNSLMAGF
jgi:tRNA nucleotidyltransferase/poly(A) polymerase